MAQVKYGTGTIFQTKDGRWKWQGYFVDDTGKKHRPTKTFNTEAEALKFQAEQVAKTEVKKAMKSKDITLAECFDLWKEAVKEGSVKTPRPPERIPFKTSISTCCLCWVISS